MYIKKFELLGRQSQYAKNLYRFRWAPDTDERDYVKHVRESGLDDDYFGSFVQRVNDEVHVYIYTD
jgi:predicted transcriptional regulator